MPVTNPWLGPAAPDARGIPHRGGTQVLTAEDGTQLDSLGQVLRIFDALTWATRYARTRGGQNVDFTRREMGE